MRQAVDSPGIQRAIQRSPQLRKARVQQGAMSHAIVLENVQGYLHRLEEAGLIACESTEPLAYGVVAVVNGVYKRVVHDGAATLEPALLEGAVELISRALFRSSAVAAT